MFWEGKRRKRNADDCYSSFMLFLQYFQLHLFLEKRALATSFLLIITTLLLCYGCKQLCPWKRENGEIKDIKYDSVICQIHKYANTQPTTTHRPRVNHTNSCASTYVWFPGRRMWIKYVQNIYGNHAFACSWLPRKKVRTLQ